jgi:hypothetical protein
MIGNIYRWLLPFITGYFLLQAIARTTEIHNAANGRPTFNDLGYYGIWMGMWLMLIFLFGFQYLNIRFNNEKMFRDEKSGFIGMLYILLLVFAPFFAYWIWYAQIYQYGW